MFDGQRQLTSNALWWVFFFQEECMCKMSMTDAKTVDDTLVYKLNKKMFALV